LKTDHLERWEDESREFAPLTSIMQDKKKIKYSISADRTHLEFDNEIKSLIKH